MKLVRKYVFTFSVLLLWASTAGAQDVAIWWVTDRVITLSMSNLGSHTNVTVIESQKGLVVIETEITPYIMSKIKEAAEKYLKRDDWIYVINTHGHLHHAGGNIVFENAQVIGHETMNLNWLKDRLSTEKGRMQYCDNVGTTQGISRLNQLLTQGTPTTAQKLELQRRIDFMREVEKEIMGGNEIRNPDISFRDRLNLDLGDVHLKLTYWGDAINHSSIFVHVTEDNMLVGMGMGTSPWLPGFYGKVSLDSIRHGISLLDEISNDDFQIDLMIGIHSADLIRTMKHLLPRKEYLQDMLSELTKAKRQGLSLEQVKDEFSFNKRYACSHTYCE
jgi:glyoxylase-like metal-dependent hydrolase (beta-lactamase superfamily II)